MAFSRSVLSVLGSLALIFICSIPISAQGRFPGIELQQKCRENLKNLHSATDQFLQDGGRGLPDHADLTQIRTMLLGVKYLPDKITGPTPDCAYFLVYKSKNEFAWYCELHGMLEGDEKVSFRYHEHQFHSKIQTAYKTNPKYKLHTDRLMRRVGYMPTLGENVRFYYHKNPFTTMILVIIGLCFVYYVYTNVFGA